MLCLPEFFKISHERVNKILKRNVLFKMFSRFKIITYGIFMKLNGAVF